ncbi:glycosyltransferase [Thermus antranikianii]
MEGNHTSGPLVSIIINNYNYARFLRDAIESALGQTYPRTEVIVVDDGSTDNSREVIAGYHGRVRAIFKENGGQASAFNAGFAASRGEIVIFLDADDLLLPHAVEEVVSVWRPGLSKVQWRLQLVTGELQPLPATWPMERSMPSGNLQESVLKWGYYPSPPTSGNAFARCLLERILPMPETEWRIAADFYLLLLAAVYGDVYSLDEVLGYYRVHGLNHWHFGDEDRIEKVKHKLEQQFAIDHLKRKLLREIAQRHGLEFLDIPTPSRAKVEMAVALFNSEGLLALPLTPSRLRIALQGIYAAAFYPYMPSLWSRIRLIAWFLLTAISPRNVAKKIAVLGVLPTARPKWLATLLRTAHRLSPLQSPSRGLGRVDK